MVVWYDFLKLHYYDIYSSISLIVSVEVDRDELDVFRFLKETSLPELVYLILIITILKQAHSDPVL